MDNLDDLYNLFMNVLNNYFNENYKLGMENAFKDDFKSNKAISNCILINDIIHDFKSLYLFERRKNNGNIRQ